MLINKYRIPVGQILLYGFLPSVLKVFVYRLKGYKIGKKVSLGFGSVICADTVEVGDYAKFGFFTILRGKRICIGPHASIGSTSFIDTPFIEIGDESKINEQVFIGGMQSHDSKFVLGKNCQIMQLSYINPAISITIGDDSALGGHCLLFGHNSWLSRFEGYDVKLEPIEIGKSVALSWRVFVLPGVKIGDGSVIAPDSLVNKTIPKQCMAAGFPARVIAKHPDFPKKLEEEDKIEILDDIVASMIENFNGYGLQCSGDGGYYKITQTQKGFFRNRRKDYHLGIVTEEMSEKSKLLQAKRLDVVVSLRAIPKNVRLILNSKNIMWLDIEKKERPHFWNDLGDEVALFFRRYGVRFTRVDQ
jgi:acetyltransferase-like isoleucine patch superfamily enzyme